MRKEGGIEGGRGGEKVENQEGGSEKYRRKGRGKVIIHTETGDRMDVRPW